MYPKGFPGIDFVGKINFECVYSSHLAHYF